MDRDDFFLSDTRNKWRKFGCFLDSGDVVEFGIVDFGMIRNRIVCDTRSS